MMYIMRIDEQIANDTRSRFNILFLDKFAHDAVILLKNFHESKFVLTVQKMIKNHHLFFASLSIILRNLSNTDISRIDFIHEITVSSPFETLFKIPSKISN